MLRIVGLVLLISSLICSLSFTIKHCSSHSIQALSRAKRTILHDNRKPFSIADIHKSNSISRISRSAALFSLFIRAKPSYGKGYNAANSIFSPGAPIYITPQLPQSALLNSLPIENELIGQIQAYIESFLQLTQPANQVKTQQLTDPQSALWVNLAINAQRAAGIFLYNRAELLPKNESYSQYSSRYMTNLQNDLLKLVNSSREANISDCVVYMKRALTSLHSVASLLAIEIAPLYKMPSSLIQTVDGGKESSVQLKYRNIPYLIGRATVILKFNNRRNISMIVDGFNYPITGGNFIDLVNRKYYESLHVTKDRYEADGGGIDLLILGTSSSGYRDIITGIERRIPLEVLREEELEEGEKRPQRFTSTGLARNSRVFTSASPVLSFATEGAVGMYHDDGDDNEASCSFFTPLWLPSFTTAERESNPVLERLNRRFSLFGYIVENDESVLSILKAGDKLQGIDIISGEWTLQRMAREQEQDD